MVPALCFPVVSHRFIVPINDTDGYDERSGSNLAPLVLVNAIIIIGENASTSAISSSATIDEDEDDDDDRKKIDVVNFDISEGLAWYAVKK